MRIPKFVMLACAALALFGCADPVSEDGSGSGTSTAGSSSASTGGTSSGVTGSTNPGTEEITAGSSSGSGTSSASSTTGGAATDRCTGALHVAVGGSVSSSTCPGSPGSQDICGLGNPEVNVVVDADGGAFQLTVTPGYSLIGYLQCDSVTSSQCQFGGAGAGSYSPAAGLHIFGVQRADAPCGDFTLSVAAQ